VRYIARCQAVVRFNGTFKALFTVDSAPGSQDQNILLDALRDGGEPEEGVKYEVTFKKLNRGD
jgi:hypothetical protein